MTKGSPQQKRGFTLIELVVTMAVAGIFMTLVMNLYSSANSAFITYRKSNDTFFAYNVVRAKSERALREHPGVCIKDLDSDEAAIYRFTGEDADSLNEAFPLRPLNCKPIDKKRTLVFFRGHADSTSKALYGFHFIVDR